MSRIVLPENVNAPCVALDEILKALTPEPTPTVVMLISFTVLFEIVDVDAPVLTAKALNANP